MGGRRGWGWWWWGSEFEQGDERMMKN